MASSLLIVSIVLVTSEGELLLSEGITVSSLGLVLCFRERRKRARRSKLALKTLGSMDQSSKRGRPLSLSSSEGITVSSLGLAPLVYEGCKGRVAALGA